MKLVYKKHFYEVQYKYKNGWIAITKFDGNRSVKFIEKWIDKIRKNSPYFQGVFVRICYCKAEMFEIKRKKYIRGI